MRKTDSGLPFNICATTRLASLSMLSELEGSGVGCYWGAHVVGAVCKISLEITGTTMVYFLHMKM